MRLWYGDLISFGRFCREARFDLAFVDADHTQPHVGRDLATAARLLAAGGVIAVHDYGNPAWPDVEAAVAGFCRDAEFALADTVGSLAVLRKVC